VPAAGARSGWRTRVMLFAEGFSNAHVRLSQLPPWELTCSAEAGELGGLAKRLLKRDDEGHARPQE
jgi:hypothetical protein